MEYLLGALLVGLILGAVPMFYGAFKQRIGLGIGGFICTLIAGLILGMLLAIPVAGVFVYLIARKSKQQSEVADQ